MGKYECSIDHILSTFIVSIELKTYVCMQELSAWYNKQRLINVKSIAVIYESVCRRSIAVAGQLAQVQTFNIPVYVETDY